MNSHGCINTYADEIIIIGIRLIPQSKAYIKANVTWKAIDLSKKLEKLH